MSMTEYAHIVLDDENVPVLEGSHVKVIEIILDHLAHGSDAQEMHRQFPHLSLGQIHSALAYYYDHQAQIDQDIARRLENVEGYRKTFGSGPLAVKLRAKGLIP